MSQLKQCIGCKRQLPQSEFYPDKRASDGLVARCRECSREYNRQRRRKQDNAPQYDGEPKWCSGCRRWQPRVEFYRCRRNPDGLDYWCKDCRRKYSHKRKYEEGTEYEGDSKHCPQCGEWNPRTEFYHDRCAVDGLSSHCKTCGLKVKKAERQQYHSPQYEGEKRCPQCGEWKPRTAFHCDKTMPDGLCGWCKECKRSRVYQFRKEHPAKSHEYRRNYSARKKANGGSFTAAEWQSLCDYYGNCCLRCGAPASEHPLTVDHVIPISEGGSNDIANIQPLCNWCNFSKHTKIIDYRFTPEVAICPAHL